MPNQEMSHYYIYHIMEINKDNIANNISKIVNSYAYIITLY